MTVSAVVSKMSQQVMDKALSKSEGVGTPSSGGSSFKDVMSQVDSSSQFADALGVFEQVEGKPVDQMQSLGGDGVSFTPGEESMTLSKPNASEKVMDMLAEVNKGHLQMDGIMNQILYSGKKFSMPEMLVIQSHVFQFAQMTELTVKVAEHSVTSVKSVLNTQVQ